MNILDFIFPKRCLTCWRFGKYFCDHCASSIRTIGANEAICPVCGRLAFRGMTHPRCKTKYSLDGLTSIFRYDGIIKQAVKTLKYRRVTNLAKEFVSLVPSSVFNNVTIQQYNNCILVPIPLHPSRFRDRGFNQAEVLGRLFADRLYIPIRTDILRRMKATTAQVEMKDRKERLKNMSNVFDAAQQNGNIVLFDDVFTTGATMRAAGESLKRVGAKSVWAVTIAR